MEKLRNELFKEIDSLKERITAIEKAAPPPGFADTVKVTFSEKKLPALEDEDLRVSLKEVRKARIPVSKAKSPSSKSDRKSPSVGKKAEDLVALNKKLTSTQDKKAGSANKEYKDFLEQNNNKKLIVKKVIKNQGRPSYVKVKKAIKEIKRDSPKVKKEEMTETMSLIDFDEKIELKDYSENKQFK